MTPLNPRITALRATGLTLGRAENIAVRDIVADLRAAGLLGSPGPATGPGLPRATRAELRADHVSGEVRRMLIGVAW